MNQVKTLLSGRMLKNRPNSYLLSRNTLADIVQDCRTFAYLLAVKRKELIYEIKKALGE